jgi:magnesium-transporting ATPase (P-type)
VKTRRAQMSSRQGSLDDLPTVGDELQGKGQTNIPSMRSARDLDGADLAEGSVHIIQQYPFTADRKMMSTLVSLDASNPLNGPVRVYVSGASEIVLRRSTTLLWPHQTEGRDEHSPSRLVQVTPQRAKFIEQNVIHSMASQSLRTIGLAYRDFGSRDELPASWRGSPDEWTPGTRTVEEGLTFYGVIGIKDPLRADVKESVSQCTRAGIMVRMVTGDNATTAAAIAKECGILSGPNDLVIEGPVFRNLTPAELDKILPHLKVMARSSPRDKNLLVRRLNGNLPKNKEEWEKEHADEEFIWDTDAALYEEEELISTTAAASATEEKAADIDGGGHKSELVV